MVCEDSGPKVMFCPLVANGNVESIVHRGQALGAISVNVQPISLREVFLESLDEDRS